MAFGHAGFWTGVGVPGKSVNGGLGIFRAPRAGRGEILGPDAWRQR